MQALSFGALGVEAAAASSGRANGHSVARRCGLGRPSLNALFQHHGARRWRVVTAWLMQLVHLLAHGALDPTRATLGRKQAWRHTAVLVLGARNWRALETPELTRCREATGEASAVPQVPERLREVTAASLRCIDAVRGLLRDANVYADRMAAAESRAEEMAC